jgi:hypothetical protein
MQEQAAAYALVQPAGSPVPTLADLYEEAPTDMVRLPFLMTGSAEVAQDVVQDAFVALHRVWSRVRDPRPYLRRTVVKTLGSDADAPWVVIAQVPANAMIVRAVSDAMAPVGGIAVLVGHGRPPLTSANVSVEALDASGAIVARGDAFVGDAYIPASTDCGLPEGLPPSGHEQPADPAAARRAIVDVFDGAYGSHFSDTAAFEKAFDDARGFSTIVDSVRRSTDPIVKAAVVAKFTVDEIVFLSPTRAALSYHIDIGSAHNIGETRYTEANLIDGSWKLSRYGVCADVPMIGMRCPEDALP